MLPVIDMTKEYGIVLEGGGAKGAYQIGAWKALVEAGVKIKGIAGTSVGALNGALMCMGDLENAEQVWETISYSRIMDVDDEKMAQLFNGELGLAEALSDGLAFMTEGGVDITPLKELIAKNIDEDAILASPIELYVLTFCVDELKELDVDLKKVDKSLMKDFLLASAYLFPVFKNEKIRGKRYIDGGAINNVPLGSLVDRGYKDIIMIRIYGVGREKKVKLPEDANLITVAPRVQLGNIIDFDYRKSRRNLKIGYFDAKRFLYGLAGKIYYIEEKEEECYYLNQFLKTDPERTARLMERFRVTQKDQWLRRLTEQILPAMAVELKLDRDWTYRELYLAMLEATAKLCRIQKYNIYTLAELRLLTQKKLSRAADPELLPAFAWFI